MKAAWLWLLPKLRPVKSAITCVCVWERLKESLCFCEQFEQACANWCLMNITLLTLGLFFNPHCPSFSSLPLFHTHTQANHTRAAKQSVSLTAVDGIQSANSDAGTVLWRQSFKIKHSFADKPWKPDSSTLSRKKKKNSESHVHKGGHKDPKINTRPWDVWG